MTPHHFLVLLFLSGMLAACDSAEQNRGEADRQATDEPENDETLADLGSDVEAGQVNQQDAYLEAYARREDVVVRDSGLMYRVVEQGSGDRPDPGEQVRVHYRGSLITGQEFDSSYARGAPAEFPSDQLIPGWVEALSLMQEGAVWELVIPPDLAYGESGRGPIPGGAALVFQVELLEVLGDAASGEDAEEPAEPTP
ncbi:MAG: FKBP-type peptidyl-prolyl cis-trans isomerase [Rhodothalassiaceae bacterium]